MQDSIIQVSVEKRLKDDAEYVYSTLGIDLPTAIRIFLTRSVKVRGIPFAMRLHDPEGYYNDARETMKKMSRRAVENGTANMTLEEINAEIEAVRMGLPDEI